jgi:hypothetical protein
MTIDDLFTTSSSFITRCESHQGGQATAAVGHTSLESTRQHKLLKPGFSIADDLAVLNGMYKHL